MATVWIPPPTLHERLWKLAEEIANAQQAKVTVTVDSGRFGGYAITINRSPASDTPAHE